MVDCLDLAGIPAFAEERAGARQRPADRHRRPADVLEPDPGRALRRRDADGRGRGDAARADRGAPRGAATATALLAGLAARPGFYVPSIHGDAPARGRRGERREPARLLADPDAAHRAARHVPDRARARLPPRLHLLRDAAVDQRRHAPGRAREGEVADPGRRPPRRAGRRRGHRSPGLARDPAPHRRQRPRGRHLQPARRSAGRRDRRPA